MESKPMCAGEMEKTMEKIKETDRDVDELEELYTMLNRENPTSFQAAALRTLALELIEQLLDIKYNGLQDLKSKETD